MSTHDSPRKKKRERAQTPRWRSFVMFMSAASVAAIYLFVTAPAPLEAHTGSQGRTVPMRAVFALLELENDAARALWTEDIVNHGTEAGLVFGEHWRDAGSQEGPLPALFLRETARHLERTGLGLRVFLGSRYPINTANHLSGQQASHYANLEVTGMPQFFFESSTAMHTAMFADRAVVAGCVTCHNEHADSPKTDWVLGDLMGATTWMYPEERVSADRALALLAGLRESIRAAYASYLDKVATLARPPEVGDRWPAQGYFVPSVEVFMAELARRTSLATLHGLLDPEWALAAAADDAVLHEQAAAIPPVQVLRAPAGATSRASELPTLVIRSTRSTRVTVEHKDARLMVTRLPAGGSTALTARPPLRVKLSQFDGVEIEYDGKRVPIPARVEPRPAAEREANGDRRAVEIALTELREGS